MHRRWIKRQPFLVRDMGGELVAVYASNDGYARHLGTSMCSLFDKNRDFPKIHVYVLSMGLSEESRAALLQVSERFKRKLTFVEMGDLRDRFDYEVDTGGYDISIMLRLFMGEMLPETVERVLYLDCDTVVVRSLKRLWRENLCGNIAGAVMEPTIYQAVKESVDLTPEEPYFNSGVLLVDLKRWREEDVQQKLLDFWREKGGKLFASDQDVINGTLKGRIRALKPEYNFFTNYRYFSYGTLVRHAASYRVVPREDFRAAKRHPVIIHYMGDERPWIAGNLNHYRLAYEKYLAQTPWAGTPKETGKELYMLAYHMLDYVTAVCPAVRWEISRRLGMKLVERRSKGE